VNEGRNIFTFDQYSIINALCEDVRVRSVGEDLTPRKANAMDLGWFKKLSNTPLTPQLAPRIPPQEAKQKEIPQPCERYNKLELTMASAMVDISKSMHFSMNQFEDDPELVAAMGKIGVGPTTSSLFKQCQGNKLLLEYQQYLEKLAFKKKHESQIKEFEMEERQYQAQ